MKYEFVERMLYYKVCAGTTALTLLGGLPVPRRPPLESLRLIAFLTNLFAKGLFSPFPHRMETG